MMLFGMATLAVCGPTFHLAMAILTTLLVRQFLAEAGDFGPFGGFMTFLAILDYLGMRLVFESDAFFKLDHVSGKC